MSQTRDEATRAVVAVGPPQRPTTAMSERFACLICSWKATAAQQKTIVLLYTLTFGTSLSASCCQGTGTFRGEAGLAQVNLQEAPAAWTYERRASVKLAKSQLRTVRASFENPSLEPKVQTAECRDSSGYG